MAASRRTLVRENGDVRTTAVIIDRLEAGFGDSEETWLWDVQGWTGGDINRFWWKSEGEGDFGGGLPIGCVGDREQAQRHLSADGFVDRPQRRVDGSPGSVDADHDALGFHGCS